jgi:hypothetical protein
MSSKSLDRKIRLNPTNYPKTKLYEYLKRKNIKGISKLNKQKLIEIINNSIRKGKKQLSMIVKNIKSKNNQINMKVIIDVAEQWEADEEVEDDEFLEQIEKEFQDRSKKINREKKIEQYNPMIENERNMLNRVLEGLKETMSDDEIKKEYPEYYVIIMDRQKQKEHQRKLEEGREKKRKLDRMMNELIVKNNEMNEKRKYDKLILNQSKEHQQKLYSSGIDIKKPHILSWIDIIEMYLLKLITNNNYGVISFKSTTYDDAGNIDDSKISHYTITRKNYEHIISLLEPSVGTRARQLSHSDMELTNSLIRDGVDEINFKLVKRATLKKRLKHDGFFKYRHNLPIDLRRYQIFHKDDVITEDEYLPCVVFSMIQSGILSNGEINMLKSIVKYEYVPVKKYEEIAEKLNCKIILSDLGNTSVLPYGSNKDRVIKLCRVDEHCFINDGKNVDITEYAIKHYDDVKNIKNFHKIEKKRKGIYKKSNKKQISVMRCLRYLMDDKEIFLERVINHIKLKKDDERKIDNLEFCENECTEIKYSDVENINNKDKEIIFFDFEATTDQKIHEAYHIRAIKLQGETMKFIESKCFDGEYCALNFLKWMKKDSVIIAHNIKYDLQFIFKYLISDKLIERDGKVMGGSAMFYNKETEKTIRLTFRDSYFMISTELSQFSKMFLSEEEQKSIRKEIMPYKIYTAESVKEDRYSCKDAMKYLDKKDRIGFKANVIRWGLRNKDGTFDHLEYARKYCEMDVLLLMKGYLKFREWIMETTELDVINYTTISSIAYSYLKKKGGLEGCYEVGGVVREFMQKCIVGGRCMLADNEKVLKDKLISDFDAVSLYPSAMSRMGFLMGKPFVLKRLDYDYLRSLDGYFVEIDVTKVNKNRIFPLMSRVSKNSDDAEKDESEKNIYGTREFDNNLLGTHYVDKTTLEDWIEYQDIEFTVIRGYGFNSGRNYAIKDIITELFEKRREAKNNGNQIQEIYKLLMNSCYGKTILRDMKYNIKYIKGESEALKYISRHCDYIREYNSIHGTNNYKWRIKELKSVDDLQTCPQVGVEILSMSKRIMNEVMCLAEDIGVNIYYQDTDSMHIDKDQIEDLSMCYREKYRRELIGKEMGQFHNDFDFEHDKGTEPVSVELIAVGKKSYCDKVLCIRDGKETYDYQIRLKGIPRNSIDDIVHRQYEGDYIEMYRDLYNGKEIEFNLLANNKVKFVFNKNLTVSNRKEFKRKVKF